MKWFGFWGAAWGLFLAATYWVNDAMFLAWVQDHAVMIGSWAGLCKWGATHTPIKWDDELFNKIES